MVIHKFTLTWVDTLLFLPDGAQVLSAGMQGDDVVLWALVDPDLPPNPMPRRFRAFNTGETIPPEIDPNLSLVSFIQTLTTDNGIVWHVWEVDLSHG